MGVRISWLMLARNWLLARLDCSASFMAWRSDDSYSFCRVMSWAIPRKPRISPCSPCMGEIIMDAINVLPSLRTRVHSPLLLLPTTSANTSSSEPSRPRVNASVSRMTSIWVGSKIAWLSGWPTISLLLYPSKFSAPRLNTVTVRLTSVASTNTSVAESSTACKVPMVCSRRSCTS